MGFFVVGGHLATDGRKGGHQTLLFLAHTHHRSCCKLESQKFRKAKTNWYGKRKNIYIYICQQNTAKTSKIPKKYGSWLGVHIRVDLFMPFFMGHKIWPPTQTNSTVVIFGNPSKLQATCVIIKFDLPPHGSLFNDPCFPKRCAFFPFFLTMLMKMGSRFGGPEKNPASTKPLPNIPDVRPKSFPTPHIHENVHLVVWVGFFLGLGPVEPLYFCVSYDNLRRIRKIRQNRPSKCVSRIPFWKGQNERYPRMILPNNHGQVLSIKRQEIGLFWQNPGFRMYFYPTDISVKIYSKKWRTKSSKKIDLSPKSVF